MYFSTPLKLYIFKGIENRVVYVRQTIQCARLRQDSGQKWTQHEVDKKSKGSIYNHCFWTPLQGGPCIFNLFLLLWAGKGRKETILHTYLQYVSLCIYSIDLSILNQDIIIILYYTIRYYTTLLTIFTSCLSFYLSIYLSIILSIYLSIYLSTVYLSIYLSFLSFFLSFSFFLIYLHRTILSNPT